MSRINCAWCKNTMNVPAEENGEIVLCPTCKKENKIFVVARARKWFPNPPDIRTTFVTSSSYGTFSTIVTS